MVNEERVGKWEAGAATEQGKLNTIEFTPTELLAHLAVFALMSLTGPTAASSDWPYNAAADWLNDAAEQPTNWLLDAAEQPTT